MKRVTIFFIAFKYLLIILFVYTAVSKLIAPVLFHEQLSALPVFGKMAALLSVLIPVAEIITAMLLLMDKTEKPGWWLSAGLLTSFTGYLFYMLAFAARLPCTCGGIIEQLSWKQHLVINIILAGLGWLRILQNKNLYAYKEVS